MLLRRITRGKKTERLTVSVANFTVHKSVRSEAMRFRLTRSKVLEKKENGF